MYLYHYSVRMTMASMGGLVFTRPFMTLSVRRMSRRFTLHLPLQIQIELKSLTAFRFLLSGMLSA